MELAILIKQGWDQLPLWSHFAITACVPLGVAYLTWRQWKRSAHKVTSLPTKSGG